MPHGTIGSIARVGMHGVRSSARYGVLAHMVIRGGSQFEAVSGPGCGLPPRSRTSSAGVGEPEIQLRSLGF